MTGNKLFLLLSLGVVGISAATEDVLTIRQETDNGERQTVVEDSKGAVINIQPIVRDTSWSPYITYSPNSFYELLPQLYKDKISIREVKLGKLDFILGTFVAELPRQWQPSSDAVTVWHLDLFDALTIAVQAANPVIAQAALTQVPYTKSALVSGKTTDFMTLVPFSVDGKFKIDQFIDLVYDSMMTKINKYRTIKGVSTAYAASLAVPGLNKVAKFLTIDPINVVLARVMDQSTEPLQTKWLGKIASGFSLLTAVLAHRLEHMYIDGYIKVLGVLVNAENVVFDRADAREKITYLKNKLMWFGEFNSNADKLQNILNKIS